MENIFLFIYLTKPTALYIFLKALPMDFAVLIKKTLFIMDVQIIDKKILKSEFYGMTETLKLNGQ